MLFNLCSILTRHDIFFKHRWKWTRLICGKLGSVYCFTCEILLNKHCRLSSHPNKERVSVLCRVLYLQQQLLQVRLLKRKVRQGARILLWRITSRYARHYLGERLEETLAAFCKGLRLLIRFVETNSSSLKNHYLVYSDLKILQTPSQWGSNAGTQDL